MVDNSYLFTIVGQLFFASIIASAIMQMMKLKQRSDQQEDIQKLVAKLSKLRLILVSKVKRKIVYYRNVFPMPLIPGDVMDATLNQMGELRFESGIEFQNYIDICKSVNRFLKMALEKYEREILVMESKRLIAEGLPPLNMQVPGIPTTESADGNTNPGDPNSNSAPSLQFKRKSMEITAADIQTEGPYSFFTPDKKMDFGIILAMDEIVNCTFKIRDKITIFNREYPKSPLVVIDPIQFPSLMDIKRIYAENPDIQKNPLVQPEKVEEKSEPTAA